MQTPSLCEWRVADPKEVKEPMATPNVLDTPVLTVDDVAALLKLPRESIYQMTRQRARRRHRHPLPTCRLGGHLRFRTRDVLAWIDQCAADEDAHKIRES